MPRSTMVWLTGTAAPRLVRFAKVQREAKVLDVACGTGVVALAAARAGAKPTGIDLTPELVAHAKRKRVSLGRRDLVLGRG